MGKLVIKNGFNSNGDSQITGSLDGTDNILLNGGILSIKNQGAQSEARFYCEVNNAHYTALKAQPHALFSGNPITLLPAFDLDFAAPHFLASITASGNISASGTSSAASFAGDGNLQRPITASSTNLSASMDNAGYYFRVGGNVTCSIGTNAALPIKTGTEYEFFQTSSAGNFYITGSGITINSKGGNIQLAGQFSAATLKKVGTDEWDLIGDLG